MEAGPIRYIFSIKRACYFDIFRTVRGNQTGNEMVAKPQLGRYWIGTLYEFEQPLALPPGALWFKGQQEICPTTARVHLQVCGGFDRNVRLATVKRVLGSGHWELCRSAAADAYVWKQDTRVEGTQFEFGAKPMRRNDEKDWEKIKESAKSGNFDAIPGDVYVR